jgi:hypothetical protein
LRQQGFDLFLRQAGGVAHRQVIDDDLAGVQFILREQMPEANRRQAGGIEIDFEFKTFTLFQ